MTTNPRIPPVIEVGTKAMLEAFEMGLEHYQPTAGGHKMLVEAGITQHSLENLKDLAEGMGAPIIAAVVGRNSGVLVVFGTFPEESYLATGFSVGYYGEGPTGFARFLAKHGFGDLDDLRYEIGNMKDGEEKEWKRTAGGGSDDA